VPRSVGHRVARVEQQVHGHLLHLAEVDDRLARLGVEAREDPDAGWQEAAKERDGLLHHPVEVEPIGPLGRAAHEGHELGHDGHRALARDLDGVDVHPTRVPGRHPRLRGPSRDALRPICKL
jgi:hypothetical protein